jgi:hypothetical protein
LVLGRLAENFSFVAAFAAVAGVLVLGATACIGLRSSPTRSTSMRPQPTNLTEMTASIP